jgi:hypothetical protein
MIFEQKRWPLHTALAWVITRDLDFTNRSGPGDFWPYVPRDEHETLGEEREAWRLLFGDMKEGRVPVFGKLWGGDSAEEMRILPEELEGLDWGMHGEMPGLRRRAATQDEDEHLPLDADIKFTDVLVSSSAMISYYRRGSDPIALNTKHTGPPERPDGPDFMALSAAAYWIAAKGGTFAFFARDDAVWKAAYKELLVQIVGGQVRVVGRREKDGFAEPVDGFRFSGIEIDYPYPAVDDETSINLMFGDRPFLRCGSPITTADWQRHNDCLRGGHSAPRISHLQVSKPDVARLWAFASNDEFVETSIPRRAIDKAEIEDVYKQWIAGNVRTTREDDIAYMRKEFPGIVTDGRVRDLRSLHAPEDWQRPGRPRKGSKSG